MKDFNKILMLDIEKITAWFTGWKLVSQTEKKELSGSIRKKDNTIVLELNGKEGQASITYKIKYKTYDKNSYRQ